MKLPYGYVPGNDIGFGGRRGPAGDSLVDKVPDSADPDDVDLTIEDIEVIPLVGLLACDLEEAADP